MYYAAPAMAFTPNSLSQGSGSASAQAGEERLRPDDSSCCAEIHVLARSLMNYVSQTHALAVGLDATGSVSAADGLGRRNRA
jgi:hypothetical protein